MTAIVLERIEVIFVFLTMFSLSSSTVSTKEKTIAADRTDADDYIKPWKTARRKYK